MSAWTWVENPAYAGQTPRLLTPDPNCHDGSPFVTIECSACRAPSHYHETYTDLIPRRDYVRSRCATCRVVFEFPPGCFAEAFAEMRRRGWLAPREPYTSIDDRRKPHPFINVGHCAECATDRPWRV